MQKKNQKFQRQCILLNVEKSSWPHELLHDLQEEVHAFNYSYHDKS